MKRFLLLLSFVVVPLVPISHAYARISSGITVSSTAHGIRLTLVVPQRSYPRNALVRFAVAAMLFRDDLILPSEFSWHFSRAAYEHQALSPNFILDKPCSML
jgi:hypothetical protein